MMPVGAVAELDGSFSEGDDLSFVWSVEPAEGAVLHDAESPFATLTAEVPGLYTLSLEVCDAAGRCDVAETWARVDDPGSASRITDWGIDEFAGAESGAGVLEIFKPTKAWCDRCNKLVDAGTNSWQELCRSIPEVEREARALCWAVDNAPDERKQYCAARCAK
jgi:hypothetical protein